MKVMTLKIPTFGLLFSLCLVQSIQARASPFFPQEDDSEAEDTTDDEDDAYDEEENTESSTVAEEEEEEDEDKDEKEDAQNREVLANRLGIKNFSSAALAEKASSLVITYLKRGPPKLPLPFPLSRPKPTGPRTITTKKYKIRRSTTPSPISPSSAIENTMKANNTTNQMRKFIITVPKGINGTGGGIIEIAIPMDMIMKNHSTDLLDPDHDHSSQMLISSSDEQGVKNIEAAIMEALIIAQQMAAMKMMNSSLSPNNTEAFELDIAEIQTTQSPEGEERKETSTTEIMSLSATSTSLQQEIIAAEEPTTPLPDPPTQRPTRKRRIRSTTLRGPTAEDPYEVGPVTDIIVSEIRSGQLPQFLWKSIVKLASSKYAQIAVDAVECAVFYYCPDDTELGTLTKGGKF